VKEGGERSAGFLGGKEGFEGNEEDGGNEGEKGEGEA
jgi:hypothetical protein